jgi:chromosome segregation ATPase
MLSLTAQVANLPTSAEVVTMIAVISGVVSAIMTRLLMPALREHLSGHFPSKKEHRKEIQDVKDDTNRLGRKVGEVVVAMEQVRELARNAHDQGIRLADQMQAVHRDFELEIVPTLKELNQHMAQIRIEIASYNEHRKNVDGRLDDHERRLRKSE